MSLNKVYFDLNNICGGIIINKIFNNKSFILLTLGSFVSTIGDHMYNIALTISLYTVSNSIAPVALMWLSRALLRIPIQYISGILSDSINKKHIIVFNNLISSPIALILILVNNNNLWISYIVAFLLQSLNDIDTTSQTALLPDLVNREELSYSNSIFSVLGTISMLISPALAGILYKSYGSDVLFIINSLSFLVAGLLFIVIKYTPKTSYEKAKLQLIKSGVEGFRILKNYKNVLTIFTIMITVAILGRFYEIYKVIISDDILSIGAEGIVLFSYAMALGGLLTPLIVKLINKYIKIDKVVIFTLSSVIVSSCFVFWGYANKLYLSLIFLLVLGMFQSIQGVYSRTIIQLEIPKKFIGRVYSLYKIVLTLSAILGIAISPLLNKVVGVKIPFLIFGSISILVSLFFVVNNSKTKVSNVKSEVN